ncbi:MAG: PP2C family protein-serine/threonine phosphatase [Terriglobia bacterium]
MFETVGYTVSHEMDASLQGVPTPRESESPRVLIADDQPAVLEALQLLLKGEGYETETAGSPDDAVRAFERRYFDAVLVDLNYARDTTSGQEGLDLVMRMRRLNDRVPIVAMTGWGSISLAVESMRSGACDFILKPWKNDQVLNVLRREIARRRLYGEHETSERFEMAEARSVERALLSRDLPQISGFSVAARWQTQRHVGGDYFEVRRAGRDRVALAIADACGKGVPAALLMSSFQSALRLLMDERLPAQEICSRLNRLLREQTGSSKFVSCFIAILDVAANRLSFSNAGHPGPMLLSADSRCARLESTGPVLGAFPEPCYQEEHVAVRPADTLLLFTDGVTEARNPAGEEFGENRLAELLSAIRGQRAEAIAQRVTDCVAGFSDGALEDDATLLVLQRGRE